MSWSERVFNYCERGHDPQFWAEPLNAVSNAAFLAAAIAAGQALRRAPAGPHGPSGAERVVLWTLVGLVGAIGIGSFLFHTTATRWALLADVLPITVFMHAYLAHALRSVLGLAWIAIALILPAFFWLGSAASGLKCAAAGAPAGAALVPCLNGSLGYLPALLALFVIGGLGVWRGHAGGRPLLAAGGIFLASVILRTIDQDVCAATEVLGRVRGTHVLWHLLNAATLYLLLRAAIDGAARRRREGDAEARAALSRGES